MENKPFYTFWSCGSAWGSFSIESNAVRLRVEMGRLILDTLRLPAFCGDAMRTIRFKSELIKGTIQRGKMHTISFSQRLDLSPGDELVIEFK